jgi:uncharacterized protein
MKALRSDRLASTPPPGRSIEDRVAALPWPGLTSEIDGRGFATVSSLLAPPECRDLVALYDDPGRFRSRVIMARHGFGQGEYQYFADPLPELVAGLRTALYPHLVPVANAWADRLGAERGFRRFPATLAELQAECRAAGQHRPTPLLLKYGPDDYNCLHQDIYGDLVFPLQLTVLLTDPREFSGGEFLLTEQRPRKQSRAEVVPLGQGDAVIFAVRHRPVQGTRGHYRANMRHGVSRLRQGTRFTLGIIFHDAA